MLWNKHIFTILENFPGAEVSNDENFFQIFFGYIDPHL